MVIVVVAIGLLIAHGPSTGSIGTANKEQGGLAKHTECQGKWEEEEEKRILWILWSVD